MPLTNAQIIEIQESARFNYLKRLREKENEEELVATIEKRVAESKQKPKATADTSNK